MDLNNINLLEPQKRIFIAPQPSKRRKHGLLFCAIIPLIILCGSIFVIKHYAGANWPRRTSAYSQTTLKPKLNIFQAVKNFLFRPDTVLQGQKEGRINILLLGIGGEGHDGPYLSDTNMIISVNTSANQIALISIPRDLAISIDGQEAQRINYANALGEARQAGGGGEYARQIFEKAFGVNIPYYVRVDFKAFQDLVDAVDGVEINVPQSFIDYSYPGPNESYQTISFQAGPQKMDGNQALKYARSRHGTNDEASDFARAKRQQLVLAAIKEKILSAGTYLNPIRIQKILESLSNHIITNLDFGQIMYLADLARSIDGNVKTLVLDNNEDGFLVDAISDDGAYLLQPKNGNFEAIRTAINSIFDSTSTPTFASSKTSSTALTANYNVGTIANNATTAAKGAAPSSLSAGSAKIEIQNGTWHVGLAAKYKQSLEEKGLSISAIGNCYQRPVTNTIIYLLNPNAPKETIGALDKELKTHATAVLPNWLTTDRVVTSTDGAIEEKYKADTDVLVVLGIDAVK